METKKSHREKTKTNRVRRAIHLLEPGDIIHTYVPFEENTRDYFNGHDPETIRSSKYVNRRGESGKSRIIIYMGMDGDDLLYLPITSSHGSGADQYHQYRLKDNSMINLNGRYPVSYVEVDSLRALRTHPKKSFNYNGSITEIDRKNIMHRVTHTTMQYGSMRDFRGIIPDDMVEGWEKELEREGFTPQPTQDGTMLLTKDAVTITRTAQGMVLFHRSMDRESVHLHVSQREGRLLPDLPEIQDSFITEVNDLTHSKERQL